MTGHADLDAYEVLVREHEDMLQAYLLGLVKDPRLAEELAQETFVTAYRHMSSLKDKRAFASWLRTIAHNLSVDEIKHRSREIPTDPEILQGMEDVFESVASQAADTWGERAKIVEDCFQKLPDKLKNTCRLHYFDDLPTAMIADKSSISLPSVLKQLERGRNLIRQCVEQTLGLQEERIHGNP